MNGPVRLLLILFYICINLQKHGPHRQLSQRLPRRPAGLSRLRNEKRTTKRTHKRGPRIGKLPGKRAKPHRRMRLQSYHFPHPLLYVLGSIRPQRKTRAPRRSLAPDGPLIRLQQDHFWRVRHQLQQRNRR